MARKYRISLAIVLGLALGWTAAGYLQGHLPGTVASVMAAETPADADSHAGPVHHDAADEHDEYHDLGEGRAQAQRLVPREATDWYRPVLNIAAALFIAALVIGSSVLALKGPDAPDPADHHDDHGDHGEHGDGHH